jgi:hypothetical protein
MACTVSVCLYTHRCLNLGGKNLCLIIMISKTHEYLDDLLTVEYTLHSYCLIIAKTCGNRVLCIKCVSFFSAALLKLKVDMLQQPSVKLSSINLIIIFSAVLGLLHAYRQRQTDFKRYCRNASVSENMKPSNLLPDSYFSGIIQDSCCPVVFVWDFSLFPKLKDLCDK